ncbi:MHC class I polypeptide-related sequence A [Sciurus carolinensis]|uniref:MHC class I polypeptide-related sequence A n=1 Tax=Sciurus carolinensis TaxID=30640 RepID=A0AA41MEA0_SCICA|nr:MHC class I polypeptide-related sequence A [Sciurus carolinensis]
MPTFITLLQALLRVFCQEKPQRGKAQPAVSGLSRSLEFKRATLNHTPPCPSRLPLKLVWRATIGTSHNHRPAPRRLSSLGERLWVRGGDKKFRMRLLYGLSIFCCRSAARVANSLTMGLSGVLLLLAEAALCAPRGAASGAHSLHYNLTVRSQGGSVQSRYFAEGYWDHQLFLQYDSDNQGSAEPWGPWAEKPLGTENWNTEMQDLAEHIKKLKMTLADINAWQEQKGGSHSLQETRGCKIQEDNSTRAFWNFHYDGEPFLSYDPETRSWTVQPSSARNLAMEVKNSWDADGMQSKDYWAHVHGELCGKLRYLVSRKGSSHSSGASAQGTLLSPAVNVTCVEASEDTINLTCWASGFYPQSISLIWLQDGEPLSQDAQQSEGVFLYEYGSYQTWVSTRIPQGQEQRFSCHVGHSGKNSTVPVSCVSPAAMSKPRKTPTGPEPCQCSPWEALVEQAHGSAARTVTSVPCVASPVLPRSCLLNVSSGELEKFQDRLARFTMHCNDKAKDSVDAGSKELQVKRQLNSCVTKCVDDHMQLIPTIIKRMKESLPSIWK